MKFNIDLIEGFAYGFLEQTQLKRRYLTQYFTLGRGDDQAWQTSLFKKIKTQIYFNSRKTRSSCAASLLEDDEHQPTGGVLFTRDIAVKVGNNPATVLHSTIK